MIFFINRKMHEYRVLFTYIFFNYRYIYYFLKVVHTFAFGCHDILFFCSLQATGTSPVFAG